MWFVYKLPAIVKKTMIKTITQILILTIISINAIGQISSNDLNGDWTINNNDSSYYKSDTIRLYQDINYKYEIKTCSIVEWKKDKREFSIHFINICSEPGRAMTYDKKETIKLKSKNKNQIIEIIRGGKIIESFYVLNLEQKRIERNPYDIKILTLERMKKTTGR